jgi:nitrogen regulatory protein P-II 1
MVQDLVGTVPLVKLETICADEWESEIVTLFEKAAFTGNPGGGTIFVSDISRALRILTGENGERAVVKELCHP